MSQIRVHVSAPGEVPVPNTGVFTQPTSYSSSNENTYYIGLCIVIAIILAVILPVFFISECADDDSFQKKKKRRAASKLFAIVFNKTVVFQ